MPGGSSRDSRCSNQRSSVPSQTGSRPSCCASRANFSCCRAVLQSTKRRRPFAGKRWTKRASKARCPGSCAPRRASPGCCVIRVAAPTPSPASARFTTALPRVSRPRISSPRKSFWKCWATPVAAETRPMDGDAISFGPFRLLAERRLLLEADKPVRLGSRAFEILAALVERAGEVVGKEELIARAWPQTLVEESNLKIQVSALRRALGDGQNGHRYIVTVPGRGYNFVAATRTDESPSPPLAPTIAPAGAHNLPVAVTRMIGREDAVAALLSRLSLERLVTIVGPGGVGKSTVALAVAERSIASYEHGVWLVDLAPLSDPRLVPSAAATVLDLEIRSEDPLPGLLAWLRGKRMLLLLDNCEHVIEAAASLAAALLTRAPGVTILATSREPLGVAGEHEHRLGPLSCPRPSATLTAAEAAAFPAVQLFVERVTATVENFTLTDSNAPLVVEICRRLDGLPLAIEFAASRVAVLGVEGLAAHLDDSLRLLGARRTPMPRHRT